MLVLWALIILRDTLNAFGVLRWLKSLADRGSELELKYKVPPPRLLCYSLALQLVNALENGAYLEKMSNCRPI